jgi:hypothetical protein
MLAHFAGELCRLLRAAVALHQALHMIGGAVQGDHEQARFGRRAGDAGERPHFGVAQFAPRHGGGDQRQVRERMGDAHLLACRTQVQPALEIQPVRAGVQFPIPPAPAPIEFGDQREPTIIRGIELSGQRGDLRLELLQRHNRGDR